MSSPLKTNKTRYSLLPRASMDSHLSNVTEEDTPPARIEDTSSLLHSEEDRFQGYRVKLDTRWVPWLLRVLSFGLSVTTLIVESIRLHKSNRGNWRYNTGNAKFIAPIIAFLSFDILIHLTVIPYYILSQYFYFEVIFSEHASIHVRGPQASNRAPQHPRVLDILIYLLEGFIVFTLVLGLFLDLGGAAGKPGELIAQLCGWLAVIFRVLAILWPKKGIVHLSLTVKNPQSTPFTSPTRTYQYTEDAENNWGEAEGRRAQPESATTEQTEQSKGLI